MPARLVAGSVDDAARPLGVGFEPDRALPDEIPGAVQAGERRHRSRSRRCRRRAAVLRRPAVEAQLQLPSRSRHLPVPGPLNVPSPFSVIFDLRVAAVLPQL